jgi:hypothetical protein
MKLDSIQIEKADLAIDQHEQSSLSFKLNEFFQLLFPPSQNYFLLFSLFSLFSSLHHRMFDHIVPLSLIGSRFFIVFEELTGDFDFSSRFFRCVKSDFQERRFEASSQTEIQIFDSIISVARYLVDCSHSTLIHRN